MKKMVEILSALGKGEEGATAVEYTIMAAFIAAVIAATVGSLGQKLADIFNSVQF